MFSTRVTQKHRSCDFFGVCIALPGYIEAAQTLYMPHRWHDSLLTPLRSSRDCVCERGMRWLRLRVVTTLCARRVVYSIHYSLFRIRIPPPRLLGNGGGSNDDDGNSNHSYGGGTAEIMQPTTPSPLHGCRKKTLLTFCQHQMHLETPQLERIIQTLSMPE